VWIDKERYVPLKEERYATSGKLLKTTAIKSVRQFQRRWVAERAIFNDALKNDGGTEFVVIDVDFDAKIPDRVFSQASLRK
jgi:hypothetical protein